MCFLGVVISDISLCYRENVEEKAALEKMKKEMEDKANALLKQEKEIKEKQKRLSRDQDVFKVTKYSILRM
jgi:vacuolar-type H+-ATPase subunit I/STV1